jgi:cytidylate kinase
VGPTQWPHRKRPEQRRKARSQDQRTQRQSREEWQQRATGCAAIAEWQPQAGFDGWSQGGKQQALWLYRPAQAGHEKARMSLDDSPPRPIPAERKVIVAIDGPAGAGKSTIARHLARHFGLLNLETGAMYRAFGLKALRAALPLDESKGLEALSAETGIRLEPGEEENRVLLDDEDVTGLIRNQTVTDAASRVSVFPAIRAWMVRLQQQLGAGGGVVMEGRDIGTVVFPHADVKIFLDAAPEVRGLRRFDQLGPSPAVQADEVIRDLRARDARDRNRADSPLKPAPDAILLDSTHMTLEQAVQAAEEIVASRLSLPVEQQ